MIDLSKEAVRDAVRDRYSLIAQDEVACCGGGSPCCGMPNAASKDEASQGLGYGIQQLEGLPAGSNLGLGCGNPHAIAALKAGETVLDLGSGGGIDCFLASRAVGASGTVIGVDMTPAMIRRSREAAVTGGYGNVEFRLGEIEHLPVSDGSVDVILSNCVINLSPDKDQVFRDAYRVLRSGGRLAISDMVASGPLPDELKGNLELHSQCLLGATPLEELHSLLQSAGFEDIRIEPKSESRSFVKDWVPGSGLEEWVLSATIEAVKP